MRFQLVQVRVFGQISLEMLLVRERLQINERRVVFCVARIGYLDMIRVGIHTHDLALDFVRRIGKVNAVPKRFAHLRHAVDTRQTQARLIIGQYRFRLDQRFTVEAIEASHDFTRLFEHRELILAHGYRVRLERRNIRRLGYRIGQKAHGNRELKILLFKLRFYRRITL